MKIKFDPKKLLPVASLVLGLAGTLISNKIQANERETMKAELKEELMKDLLNKEN